MKKLIDILQCPLRREPVLFASLCAVLCLAMLSKLYCGSQGLGTLVANVFFTYFATAIVSLLPRYVNAVVRWALILYSALMGLLVFFGALFIRTDSAMNTLMLILQTNIQETFDFFSFYVHFKELALTFAALAIAVLVSLLIYRFITRKSSVMSGLIATGSALSLPLMFILPFSVLQTTPQLECCFTDLDLVFHHHDLREYIRTPKLTETGAVHPDNVVLVIGESHHRSHSSLCGYSRQTNPLLQTLVDSGNLVVLDSVSSPAAYTGESISMMFSDDSDNQAAADHWWERQTIPTAFKAMGYRTYWITNQKGGATRDVIADSYSQLCDTVIRTSSLKAFDGELLPLLRDAKAGSQCPGFYIVHLMGSHEAFDQRYPSDFDRFKPEDYANCPENQRRTLAAYDNSLLYNDFVLNSIIDIFAGESTLLIYCPDHGLDVYMTDPDYAAHAKSDAASQRVARQIPVFIYLSNGLRQQSPALYDSLSARRHEPFGSAKLFHCLTSLAGYDVE